MASGVSIITVDVDALRTLADRTRTASLALTDDVGIFGHGDNGVEHPMLHSALDKFDERWSDKRHSISDSLDKTATAMRSIADSFVTVDDELAACVLDKGGDAR